MNTRVWGRFYRYFFLCLLFLFILVLGSPRPSDSAKKEINYTIGMGAGDSDIGRYVATIETYQQAKNHVQKGYKKSVVPEQNSKEEAVVADITELEKPLALPPNKDKVRKIVHTIVTAYNPVPEQTDSSPCITADGTDVCKQEMNIVAANWLPFGAKVIIPDMFGERIFEVRDRMHSRFSERLDVLMYSRDEAKRFGARWLKVIVLE